MGQDSPITDRERLVFLIRKIAKEEAWQALDEHLSDYVHNQKALEEAEVQECED